MTKGILQKRKKRMTIDDVIYPEFSSFSMFGVIKK